MAIETIVAGARRTGVVERLVGDRLPVPCVDGQERPYLSFDSAASTAPLPAVVDRVAELLPWYASVHRGAGFKSQVMTDAFEDARAALLRFGGRDDRDDVAIICRNTTEAINHLAYRLALEPSDVVVTTVIEHHANLLPWARAATRRFVECERDGMFGVEDVVAALDARPAPRLLAITGASNVTGWLPPLEAIVEAAHERGVPVLVDAAQLAPHRPLPPEPDFIAFSAHKMYAPFGAGTLIGPRAAFAHGDPFLVGGNAVDLVTLDEVLWKPPPDREEAGSPNVLGAVAFAAAADELRGIGWEAVRAHDDSLACRLRAGLAAIPGVRLLGPGLDAETLPIATFVLEDVPHGVVAARLSAEFAIGVRSGCFCAHPYLARLLRLGPAGLRRFRDAALHGQRHRFPGAVRASVGASVTPDDVDALLHAVAVVASTPPPVRYEPDPVAGDWWPAGLPRPTARSRP